MKPEQLPELNKTLELLNNAASSGSAFVLEHAPRAAQELIAYAFYSNAAGFVAAMFFLGVVIVSGYCLRKLKDELVFLYAPFLIVAMVVFSIASLVSFVVSISELIKVQTAPTLVILDYVRGFAK